MPRPEGLTPPIAAPRAWDTLNPQLTNGASALRAMNDLGKRPGFPVGG